MTSKETLLLIPLTTTSAEREFLKVNVLDYFDTSWMTLLWLTVVFRQFRGFAFIKYFDRRSADRAVREHGVWRYFGDQVKVGNNIHTDHIMCTRSWKSVTYHCSCEKTQHSSFLWESLKGQVDLKHPHGCWPSKGHDHCRSFPVLKFAMTIAGLSL